MILSSGDPLLRTPLRPNKTFLGVSPLKFLQFWDPLLVWKSKMGPNEVATRVKFSKLSD